MKIGKPFMRTGAAFGLGKTVAALAATAVLTTTAVVAVDTAGYHGAKPLRTKERTVDGHVLKAKPRRTDPSTKAGQPPAKTAWPKVGAALVNAGATAVRAGKLPVWVASRGGGTAAASAAPGRQRIGVKVLDRAAARRAGVDGLMFTVTPSTAGRVGVRLDYSSFAQVFGGSYGRRLQLVRLPACALTTPGRPECRRPTPVQAGNNAAEQTLSADIDTADPYVARAAPSAPTGQAPAASQSASPAVSPAASASTSPSASGTPAASAAAASASATPSSSTPSARVGATTVPADGGVMVLAATSGTSGPSGDYKATSLAPSATWKSGTGTGEFSWSYPMRVPPVPSGLIPQVAVSYSSSSVDGRTANANGQPSWLGEGFDLWPGYIERSYKGCADDGAPQNNGIDPGDQCWAYDNATITWSGKGGELVPAGGNSWRLKDDDGTRVERLTDADTGPDTGNGDDDGEYWKVTTTDGTQYFFGRNRLPNWGSGRPETKSTWTVPVFGNDSGEPCHGSTFATSWCQQAWRWNLDYVVDPGGNAITYYYTPETNSYGRDVDTSGDTSYVRGGTLDHIEYGLRSDDLFAQAPARVDFGVSERCIPDGTFDCDPSKIGTNPDHWWDVPWDQNCTSGCTVAGKISPTFWTRKRLTKVTTRLLSGATYKDVESWSLTHGWGLADIDRDLLLTSITHTGDPSGTPLSLPPVTFGFQEMANRVDKLYDDIPPFYRYRLTGVSDESGGELAVNYSGVDCATGDIPTPETNTRRCYPQYWQPAGHSSPIRDWFHKYVATQVVQTDRTGLAPDIVTGYDYQGGAAWHFDDDDGLTKEKNKTWSQWRGYGKVVETSGGWNDMRAQTDHSYFRGMDGDRLNTSGGTKSVTVSDGEGGSYPDHESLDGIEVRTVDHVAPGGSVVTKTVNAPWHHQTASRTRPWGTTTANLTGVATTRTLTALAAGGWRETRVNNTFDTVAGLPTTVEDLGDVATAADDRCTTTSYAQNTGAWLLNFPRRIRTVALSCDKTATDLSTQLISDDLSYYDNGALGTAPTKGDVTRTDKAKSASGTTVSYVTQTSTSYDAYGRPLNVTDAGGDTTTHSYTETGGLTTATSVTSPPAVPGDTSTALVTSQALDPAFGEPTQITDPGLATARTNLTYDALGRVTKVWLPDRTTNLKPTYEFTYSITDGAPITVGTKRLTASGSGQMTTYTMYDGLLRARQTQEPGPEGGRLISDNIYDDLGKLARTYEPYYSTGAPEPELFGVDQVGDVETQHAYSYDGLGRQTVDRLLIGNNDTQEKWRTTTSYGGDRVNVDPPAGGIPTTTITDARGQTTEVRQYRGSSPAGAYDSTTYAYTPAGQLMTVNGPGGNTWTYGYDLRGRKISQSDPDKGASSSTYDDSDRVTSTTDARGKTVAYTYDPLGRKTAEYDTSTSGTKLAEWVYDTVRKGQMTSSTRFSDGAAYKIGYSAYDNRQRPTRTTYTIPSVAGETQLTGSYLFTTNYNPDDTVASIGYPTAGGLASEAVTPVYDTENLQRPVKLTSSLGSATYVSDTKHTHDGRATEYHLSTAGRSTLLSYNYEYGTQRLHESRVERESIAGVDRDAVYSYDDAGNIVQVADTSRSGVDNQCFRYDHLQRLTDAWAQGAAGACAADPAAALGGPAPYWQSFSYDDAGNRTQEVQHNADGSVSATRTYTYAAGQGHKLAAVTQTGAGAHSESYGYDASGNTTTRNTGASNQTLTWDVEGELAKVSDSVTGDTSFVHDADGNRLLRREASATTLYMGSQELRLDKGSGTVAGTRYYEHDGQIVAMRTTAGVQLLATDQNGTAQEAVDAASLAISQRRFTPFGQARGAAAPGWPGDRGFVGGTRDAFTGLTHLGARDYDPAIGRFVSVDPVFDMSDPQSWNGYVYADNSPITHSDPDGRMIVDPGGGGGHSTYNPDNDDRNTVRRLGAIARYGINYGPLRVQERLLAHDRALYDIQHENPIIAKPIAPVHTCGWRCNLKKAGGWIGRNAGTIGIIAGGVALGVALMSNPAGWVVAIGMIAAYVDLAVGVAGAAYSIHKKDWSNATVNTLGMVPGLGALVRFGRVRQAKRSLETARKLTRSGNPARRAAGKATKEPAKAVLADRVAARASWERAGRAAYAGQVEVWAYQTPWLRREPDE